MEKSENVLPLDINVSSLPLKDVINDFSMAFGVDCQSSCTEYFIDIPEEVGSGQIRGINFDNGLGLIVYKGKFKRDVSVQFSVDDVHPLKYLYSVKGPIIHSFANDEVIHKIPAHKCAIVASEKHNGHILSFNAGDDIYLVSLEIDRFHFNTTLSCEIQELIKPLNKLFTDVKANHKFYHEGYYSLEFQSLLDTLSEVKDKNLTRRLALESKALNIFVNQVLLFEDDLLGENMCNILRRNELDRIKDIVNYINVNINQKLTIPQLVNKFSMNANKIQQGFKYLFNKTINEYIASLRLDRAAFLLKNSDSSISEIAYDVGISNLSYFSKVFKERFGISPGNYRANK